MSDHVWLVVYLALLVIPWGVLELSARFGWGGDHPTMSRVIAHLEQQEGKPLRIAIAALIATLALFLTLHLGFQAI